MCSTLVVDNSVSVKYVYHMARGRGSDDRSEGKGEGKSEGDEGRRGFSAGHHRRAHHGPSARCRWWDGEQWEVRARVERFVEPSLLLLLRDGETHGYDLADSLAELVPDERFDLGNLYRLLRSLEGEGLVRSRWRDDLPGRTKRTYELTDEGRAALATWATALDRTSHTLAAFQRRYQEGQP